MRRAILLAVLAVLVAAPSAGAASTLLVTGRGWGHGIGMSQWGAKGYASRGWTAGQILAHYYPGTALGEEAEGRIRVLLEQRGSVPLASDGRLVVTDAAGRRLELEPGSFTLGPGLKLELAEETVELAPPVTVAPTGAPIRVRGVAYRGLLRLERSGRTLLVVNDVPLRSYLHAVVPREMPAFWPAEALKAQAVVARSYALVSRRPGRLFDVYDDVRSQVYGGIPAEDWRASAAVDATTGLVVTYAGAIAHTFFFSTSGGRTAAIEDEWPDAEPLPYLVSVPDPYETESPHHRWGPVAFSWPKVRRELGKALPVAPVDVGVTRNGSGRAAEVVARGSARRAALPASALRARLGLRSTWFSLSLLRLDAPPSAAAGGSARLTGRLDGLRAAALERRRPGGAWERLGTVRRSFARTVAVSGTTYFRLRAGSANGPVVRVRADARVTAGSARAAR